MFFYYNLEISVVEGTIEEVAPHFGKGETSVVVVFTVHLISEGGVEGHQLGEHSNGGSDQLFSNSSIVQ